MSKLRAAAYCRVSSNKNIQLHSLEAQKRYYEEYFKDHPLYEYVGIYADIASGIKSTTRKEFDRMIKDCKKGKIDIIFTKSISRFSRDTLDFLVAIRKLKEIGVDVCFQKEAALNQVAVGDKTAAELATLGELLTGTEAIERSETGAVMPAYSVLLLGEE